MKYRKTRTPKRTDALFLALNWYLTDQDDISRLEEYEELAKDPLTFTMDEVRAYLAKRYVGRFQTSRLRKKHSEDLYWLKQSLLLHANGKFNL